MKKTILIWIWFSVVILSIIFGYFASWYFDKKEKQYEVNTNSVIADTTVYIAPPEDMVEIKRVGNNLLKIKYDIECVKDSFVSSWQSLSDGQVILSRDSTFDIVYKDIVFSAETTVIPIVTKIENAEPITYYSGDKLIYKEVK
jgi:hypothetical protein